MRLQHIKVFLFVILGTGLFFTGCNVDMDVENFNQPDRDKLLSDPSLAEKYIGSCYYQYWKIYSYSPHTMHMFSAIADEITTSWCIGSFVSREPRIAYDNNSFHYTSDLLIHWKSPYKALSMANDILAMINKGKRFLQPDGTEITQRNSAYARYIQGLCFSKISLCFDKGVLVDETTNLDKAVNTSPYMEVAAEAVRKFEMCIALCEQNNFEIPESWWPGNKVDQYELSRLAHSQIARLLASVGRSPQERDAADWNKIKYHLLTGITHDFGIMCDGDKWWSQVHGVISNPSWARADYKCIGAADTSGNYLSWLASPVQERNEFEIHTDDRRITGDSPTREGLYFTWAGSSPFRKNRGTYHFSLYHIKRFLPYYEAHYIGFVPVLSITEMDFLMAEAELRIGNPERTAEIINRYRVVNGHLPPAEAVNIGSSGDPRSPRGSLWGKFKYDKGIETFQLQLGVAWYDRRGWGTLVPGTVLHYPIPYGELEAMHLPLYTFGGGGEGSAPYN